MYPKKRIEESGTKSYLNSSVCQEDVFHLHLSDNWVGSSNLLVHHKSKDAHHGSTSVVQLNSALLKLLLITPLVPRSLEGTIAEISGELSLLGPVGHNGNLKETNEDEDLLDTLLRDGVGAKDGSQSVGV
mmetsp:Transcript_27314/g.58000  ORF Transcript_27314/g.58000 Transcript_27314/m.58000 type:complete len:130 (-) Transcript_27314:182-571(-)